MLIGLVIGFLGSLWVDPGVYSNTIWMREPWRYFAAVWWPIVGACCGAAFDAALFMLRKRFPKNRDFK
jgi:hypothetical protein